MQNFLTAPRTLLFSMLVSGTAFAAEVPSPSQPIQTPPPVDVAPAVEASEAGHPAVVTAERPRLQVPAGTELAFEMVESLSSKTSQRGDRFSLKLLGPLVIDGQVLIPAGTLAVGEVVHADRARGSGQAGELILAARTLQAGDTTIALRAFSPAASGTGHDRTGKAAGLSLIFTPAAFMIRGGEKELPAGSLVTAKTRVLVELQPLTEPLVDVAHPAPGAIAASNEPVVENNIQGEPTE